MERIERLAQLYPLLQVNFSRMRSLVHEGMDLTYNQYKTLLTVAGREECSLRDLARELGVAMSSASQMIDRLVGRNLVVRIPDAANRRQVVIRLSREGEALIGELRQDIIQGYRRVLAQLPEADQEELVGAFETLNRILSKLS